MKTITKLIIAALGATTLLPMAAMAAGQDAKNQGYLVDNQGGAIVTSGTGLCWRDSDWTPSRAAEPCDLNNRPVAVAAPAPMPAMAAAEPIATPAAKPLPQKISFSGDALFAFDQSVLKPEGKVMLDGLVQRLNGVSYDTIVATGHTDRIGSSNYNQKLSQRRAQAVKAYLISKNVQADRIDAVGKGESQPVTKAGDCHGAKSAKVVACLQADRRVDVELNGAKTVVGSL